jgi:hypothetical protein
MHPSDTVSILGVSTISPSTLFISRQAHSVLGHVYSTLLSLNHVNDVAETVK